MLTVHRNQLYIVTFNCIHNKFTACYKTFLIGQCYIFSAFNCCKCSFQTCNTNNSIKYLIYVLGATATGPKIDVEVEEVWTYEDDNTGEELETLVIFSIEREDSDVELLAFVEFYADDEEYRFLGVVPGNSVLNVKMLGSGNYDIIYAAE